MNRRYQDRVQFVGVYVREAHAADGAWPQADGQAACNELQPKTFEERIGVAQRCSKALNMTLPLLVDELNDRVGHAYSGMPDRLYIIDRQGKVAYKGGRGPFGFRVGEMEQSLVGLLLVQGRWNPDEFARQALRGDQNRDGKLSREEVKGLFLPKLILPDFERFDKNSDGTLDGGDLEEAAQWWNEHPGPKTS